MSFLGEFPKAEPTTVNSALATVWKMNGMGEYVFDEASGSVWGVKPYEIEGQEFFDNVHVIQQLEIQKFMAPDGNIYVCLATDRNMAHNLS